MLFTCRFMLNVKINLPPPSIHTPHLTCVKLEDFLKEMSNSKPLKCCQLHMCNFYSPFFSNIHYLWMFCVWKAQTERDISFLMDAKTQIESTTQASGLRKSFNSFRIFAPNKIYTQDIRSVSWTQVELREE